MSSFKPISNESSLWHLGKVELEKTATTCRITFKNSPAGFHSALPVTVTANGKVVGVGAISQRKETSCACFAIDPISGVNEITVDTPHSTVLEVAFDDKPPFVPEITPDYPEPADIGAPYLEATDMLGRKVVSAEDVRGEKKRQVGIFYWTWRDEQSQHRTLSVARTLERYPAAEYSASHPAWGKGGFHPHWNEPLFGYYRNDDPYIIRRHAILLASAGVDFITFDCTNGSLIWRDTFEALLEGFRQAMMDGIKVPKISFMLNFGPLQTTEWMLRALYQELYQPGRYKELWYMLDGKPFIMAYPEALPKEGKCESDTKILDEIRSFFTFRRGQPLYEGGKHPAFPESWGWLENYPQNRYMEREDGGCEMMTVGVAQNSSGHRLCTYFNDRDTFGRSFTGEHGHGLLSPDSYKYGYNFSEQFERAIALDPDTVFITGWNEWIMGQYKEPWITDPDSTQLAMVDQFDREHSRDIEPDSDGYLDTYYLRLCHYIRKFKGARPRPIASAPLDGDPGLDRAIWESVRPIFRSDKGSEARRDWDGYGGHHYTNESGRNNLVEARVARDAESLYFYIRTASPITAPEEGKEGWMSLYLSTGGSGSAWEGFDYLINRTCPAKDGTTAILRHKFGRIHADSPAVSAQIDTVQPGYSHADIDPAEGKAISGDGSFCWEEIGRAGIAYEGDTMVITVPRALVGLDGELDFCFKWCDANLQGENPNIMDVYVSGDTAPLGRFSFRYAEAIRPYVRKRQGRQGIPE